MMNKKKYFRLRLYESKCDALLKSNTEYESEHKRLRFWGSRQV